MYYASVVLSTIYVLLMAHPYNHTVNIYNYIARYRYNQYGVLIFFLIPPAPNVGVHVAFYPLFWIPFQLLVLTYLVLLGTSGRF